MHRARGPRCDAARRCANFLERKTKTEEEFDFICRSFVFPSAAGGCRTDEAYKSWARHAFARATKAAGAADATPYALRHSIVSLRLAERTSVLDVASQAGNKASLSLDTYGHLFADFDHRERVSAEAAIRAARGARGTR